MKKSASCANSSITNIFLVLMLFTFFMLIYVYASNISLLFGPPQDSFSPLSDSSYIPANKLIVYQGSQMPDNPGFVYKLENHNSYPSIDGKPESDKSLFMFAKNRCSPNCCDGRSPLTCNSGCVCTTKEQTNFISSRGSNNVGTKCSPPDEF